jgi:organic radical activating enzyme
MIFDLKHKISRYIIILKRIVWHKSHTNHLTKIDKEINAISPSFCIAKWKQVTMHLHNGHTHSCHHPATHTIPLKEIKVNASALHNTNFKKEQRKMMLKGERPKECDYCWKVEDSGEGRYSDRIYKSADPKWAYPYLNDIINKSWDDNVNPSYVEVNFGNVCNFKCSYCSPVISSQWMEEIERYGAYPTSSKFNNLEWFKQNDQLPIPNNQSNPYIDAFWEWFPDMYNELKQFRITGGEPLLNKNTFKVLDYIIENPNSNLEVSINTNMNPPKEIFSKFLEKIKIITEQKKVKRFKLFTSAEAHGKCAEYIRHGMNYTEWLDNIHRVYDEIPSIQFTIMSTYNLLSLTSYNDFLKDILDIKKKYDPHTIWQTPIILDIPYLRYPSHQSLFIAEPEHLDMIKSHIEYMENNTDGTGLTFDKIEIDGLRRIYSIIKNNINIDTNITTYRKDFVMFVDEHDKRRGTEFLDVFPELTNTYNKWKNIK